MEPWVWYVLIAVVIVIIALLVGALLIRQRLNKHRQGVDDAWREVTGHLKRRADLIPALVATISGFAPNEQRVFHDVTAARDESVSAASPAQASTAENHLQGALRSLFGIAENYPQLTVSREFTQQQRDLVQTEDKIQAARRHYNGSVRELNAAIRTFPNNLVAGSFGFTPREFFDVADRAAISEPPRVQF